MGKIASYGTPEALELFISVMMASASIPGGLPPVMIDVEVDGKHYQEMHVDGGTMAQVFAYPVAVSAKQMAAETGLTRDRARIEEPRETALRRKRAVVHADIIHL